jgi:hypothetical protein
MTRRAGAALLLLAFLLLPGRAGASQGIGERITAYDVDIRVE